MIGRSRLATLLVLSLAAACADETPAATTAEATPARVFDSTMHILQLNRLLGAGEGIPCNDLHIPPLPAAANLKRQLIEQGDGALLVCVGDTLNPDDTAELRRLDRLVRRGRADVQLQALAAAGVDIFVPGLNDLNLGGRWLTEAAERHGVTILLSNVDMQRGPGVIDKLIVEHDGLRLACLGLSWSKAFVENLAGSSFRDPLEVAETMAADIVANDEADLVVVFSGLQEKTSEAAMHVPNVHLVVGSGDEASRVAPVVFGDSAAYVLARQNGREVGHTIIEVVGGDMNLTDVSTKHFIPDRVAPVREELDEMIATFGTSDPHALAALASPPAERETFVGTIKQLLKEEESLQRMLDFKGSLLDHGIADLPAVSIDDPLLALYRGTGPSIDAALDDPELPPPADELATLPRAAHCKSCHPAQYSHWLATDHRRAYQRVVAAGRGRDTSCMECHASGWRTPGGWYDPRNEAPLNGVSCFSCHQVNANHFQTARVTFEPMFTWNATETMGCESCHIGARSPGFDRRAQLPVVGCPPMTGDEPELMAVRQEAVEIFQRRRETNKFSPRDVFLEGRARAGMGDPEGLAMLEAAASRNTGDPRLAVQIGRILDRMGYTEHALRTLQRFLAHQNADPEANTAYMKLLLNGSDLAMRDPEMVLSRLKFIIPPDAPYDKAPIAWRILHVDALFAVGRVDEARALLDMLSQGNEENPAVIELVERWAKP